MNAAATGSSWPLTKLQLCLFSFLFSSAFHRLKKNGLQAGGYPLCSPTVGCFQKAGGTITQQRTRVSTEFVQHLCMLLLISAQKIIILRQPGGYSKVDFSPTLSNYPATRVFHHQYFGIGCVPDIAQVGSE